MYQRHLHWCRHVDDRCWAYKVARQGATPREPLFHLLHRRGLKVIKLGPQNGVPSVEGEEGFEGRVPAFD